jgi:hypothetical protein
MVHNIGGQLSLGEVADMDTAQVGPDNTVTLSPDGMTADAFFGKEEFPPFAGIFRENK